MAALDDSGVGPEAIDAAHVGNFTGELFAHQGHLGGLFASMDPGFVGIGAARHEAACASGSVALLAATAELAAGRADIALVMGIEQMRNVPGELAAEHLGVAAFHGREATDTPLVWPRLFAELAEFYEARHGVTSADRLAWSQRMFDAAQRNPRAQTRRWTFPDGCFSEDDELNPRVERDLRRFDCGQVTDGSAAVVLASSAGLARLRREARGLARVDGFGLRTAPMSLVEKFDAAPETGLVFPQVRGALADAWTRAGLGTNDAGGIPDDIDVVELHDCFSITGYALVDHLGLAPPGEARRVIADGSVRAPALNPGGGLIGHGHPVGATGVRMLLDCARQVTERAEDLQIEGVRRAQTLNIGGSATTAASFVLGREPG